MQGGLDPGPFLSGSPGTPRVSPGRLASSLCVTVSLLVPHEHGTTCTDPQDAWGTPNIPPSLRDPLALPKGLGPLGQSGRGHKEKRARKSTHWCPLGPATVVPRLQPLAWRQY